MKVPFFLVAAITVICLVSGIGVSRSELFGDFVSVDACADCHPDKVDGWKTTPHARAFADLKKQGEEKQGVPGCVRCHVVGMDADGGYIDQDLTPELVNVQCESCHGPGRLHMETQSAADITGHPDEAVCRECHTKGQDKNFDFAVKNRNVHGE